MISENLRAPVDELGRIKQDMAILTQREEQLKSAIRDSRHSLIEGYRFKVTVDRTTRPTIDWKTMAIACGATTQRIVANTHNTPITSVRVKPIIGGDYA